MKKLNTTGASPGIHLLGFGRWGYPIRKGWSPRPPTFLLTLLLITLAQLTTTLPLHATLNNSTQQQTSSYNGILVDDFEDSSDWPGCTTETTIVQVGAGACRWADHISKPDILRDFSPTFDASATDRFQFWAYSQVANDAEISIIIDTGVYTGNYYYYEFTVDWTGWRYFSIPLDHFREDGSPVGWDVVGRIRFNTNGWRNTPLPDTDLVIDEMRFMPEIIESIAGSPSTSAGTTIWEYVAPLTNNTGADQTFDLTLLPQTGYLLSASVSPTSTFITDGATESVTVTVTLPASFVNTDTGFDPQQIDLHAAVGTLVLDAARVKTIKPLPDHPRLYVDPTQAAQLQARYNHADLSTMQSKLLAQVAATSTGTSATGKADDAIRRAIEANAFLYLANGDTAAGQLAVQMALDYLGSINQPYTNIQESRQLYDSVIAGAIVYDWCAPLLTPAQRTTLIAEMKNAASLAEYGWPITKRVTYITGHFGEHAPVALLAAGIAVMHEDQEFFTRIYDEFREGLVPSRNLYYPMGKHHQGNSYGVSRFIHEIHSTFLFQHAGITNLYDPAQGQVPYQQLYQRTPSGRFLTEGDNFDPTHVDPLVPLIAAQLYNDSYMMDEGIRLANGGNYWTLDDAARTFIFWDPTISSTSISALNTAQYYPSPAGSMIARTGWDMDGSGQSSGVAMALMNVGEYYFNNHSHLDSGHFGIYYKGALALDSGVYEGYSGGYNSTHFRDYYQRTIAHNALLIVDPNEPLVKHYGYAVNTRDGGQYRPNTGNEWENIQQMFDAGKRAEVLAHEIQPNTTTPDYSYLKGDLTAGYNAPPSDNYPAKASEIKRSFVFLDLKNTTHPAALVVFDRVTATDAAFQKKWLLHSVDPPTITGSQISIARTDNGNNGRMVNNVLLPDVGNQSIQSVGGVNMEFLVDGTNPSNTPYNANVEPGAWRIELSPATSAATDSFLNVMHVMDANSGPQPLTTTRVDGDLLVGAQIADRAVLFSRDAATLTQSAVFTITAGPATQHVLITDLDPGAWTVQTANATQTHTADADGKLIYFSSTTGTHNLYPGHAPSITISAPADGSSFTLGDIVNLVATASDTEDGNLSASISWSSTIDGPIGNGGTINVNGLALGTHTISAQVTDSDGISMIDSITIIVSQASLGSTTLIMPANSINPTTPLFEWTAVTNATDYTLRITDSPTGTQIYSQTHSAVNTTCDNGVNNCTLQPAGLTLAYGEYDWQIEATNASTMGPWSPTLAYTVELGIPQLVAPNSATEPADPTFEWTAIANATGYTLVIYNVDTDTVELASDFSATAAGCSGGTNNCTLQPTGLTLSAGNYTWLVRAINGAWYGPWSVHP